MKKIQNRLLSILTAFALVASMGSVALAADLAEGTKDSAELSMRGGLYEVYNMMEDINDEIEKGYITFDTGNTLKLAQTNLEVYGSAKSVSCPKGSTLTIIGKASEDNPSTVHVEIWKDSNGSKKFAKYEAQPGNVIEVAADIDKAGEYYVAFWANKPDGTEAESGWRVDELYGVIADAAKDRTIKFNKNVYVGAVTQSTNYFKIKATKSGIIRVKYDAEDENLGYNQVTFCDSSKKALSRKVSLASKPVFGVTKGTTYYIRVDTNGFSNRGFYSFYVKSKKISDQSGSSRSKAATLSRNSSKAGMVAAGSSREDWFKIKLNKKRKVTITASGEVAVGNDDTKLVVKVYDSKLKGLKKCYITSAKAGEIKSGKKWAKGTYYVQVARNDKFSSGSYELEWE